VTSRKSGGQFCYLPKLFGEHCAGAMRATAAYVGCSFSCCLCGFSTAQAALAVAYTNQGLNSQSRPSVDRFAQCWLLGFIEMNCWLLHAADALSGIKRQVLLGLGWKNVGCSCVTFNHREYRLCTAGSAFQGGAGCQGVRITISRHWAVSGRRSSSTA